MSRKRPSPFDLFGKERKRSKFEFTFSKQFPRIVTNYFVEIHEKENIDFSSKIYHNGTILFQCHRKLFMWNIVDTRVTDLEVPLFIPKNPVFYFLLSNMNAVAIITSEGSFRYFPNTSLPEEFLQTQLFSISSDNVISVSECFDEEEDQKLFVLTRKTMYKLSLRGNSYRLVQIKMQAGLLRKFVGYIFPVSPDSMSSSSYINGILTAIDKTRNKIQVYRTIENGEVKPWDEKCFPRNLQVISYLILNDTILVVLKNRNRNNIIEIHRYPFNTGNTPLKSSKWIERFEFRCPRIYNLQEDVISQTPHFISNTIFFIFPDSFVYFVLERDNNNTQMEEGSRNTGRNYGHVRCKNVVGSGVYEGTVYVVSMKDGIQSVFSLRREREVPFFANEKEKMVYMVSYFAKNRERVLEIFEDDGQEQQKLPKVENEVESFFVTEVKRLRIEQFNDTIVAFSKYIAYLPFSKIFNFFDYFNRSRGGDEVFIEEVEKVQERVDSVFILQQVERKMELFEEFLDFLWNMRVWNSALTIEQQIEILSYGEQLGVLKGLRSAQNTKGWINSRTIKNVKFGNQVFVQCISSLFKGKEVEEEDDEVKPAHILRFFETPKHISEVFRSFPNTMTRLLSSIPENNKDGMSYTSVMNGILWFRNHLLLSYWDGINKFFRANPRLYPLHPSDARPIRPAWPSLYTPHPFFKPLMDEFLTQSNQFIKVSLNENNRTSRQRIVSSTFLDQQISLISMLLDFHKMYLRYHRYGIFRQRMNNPSLSGDVMRNNNNNRSSSTMFLDEDLVFNTLIEKKERIERDYEHCKKEYLPGLLEMGRIEKFKELCISHLFYEGIWSYVCHAHPNDTLSKLQLLDEEFDHVVDNLPYHMIRVLVKKRLYSVLMIYSKRHHTYMNRFMKDQEVKFTASKTEEEQQQEKLIDEDEEEQEYGLSNSNFLHLQFLWAGWTKRYFDLLKNQTRMAMKQRRFVGIKEYSNLLKRIEVTYACLSPNEKKQLEISQKQQKEQYQEKEKDIWINWYKDSCFLSEIQMELCDALGVYPEYLSKHVVSGEELIHLISRSLKYEGIKERVSRINQKVIVNNSVLSNQQQQQQEEEEEETRRLTDDDKEEDFSDNNEEEEEEESNFERNLKRLFLAKVITQREGLYETKSFHDLIKITWNISFEEQEEQEEDSPLLQQIFSKIKDWKIENEDQEILSLVKVTPLFQCFFDDDGYSDDDDEYSNKEELMMMKKTIISILREISCEENKDNDVLMNVRKEVILFIIRNFDIICWSE